MKSRIIDKFPGVNRRTSCLFLLAALVWLGCFPALAIRPQPLETRVGGCEQFASGQTSEVGWQVPENAMGFRGCAYKTASGRHEWLDRDPIGEAGGINLYRMVGNNPVNYVDPYGLWLGQGAFNSFGDAELNALQSAKQFFTGAPGDMTPNDGYTGYRGGSQMTQPLATDENGDDATADVMFNLGVTVAMAAIGGPEGEAADASKAKCFKSFDALKRDMPNTAGNVWHHIVEQSQQGRFGVAAIENANNVVEVSPQVNQALNALYSSIRPDITGSTTQTVRQWLSSQSIDQATAFGKTALQNIKNGTWP